MACEIICTDGAVFALWGKPSKTDIDRVVQTVERTAEAFGKPVIYITRVPSKAPPPDAAVRAHINRCMPRFIAACSSYHVLIEGDGFLSAIKRGIIASLLQFGWRSGTFFVHENEKTITTKVDRSQRSDVEGILHVAGRQGMLTAPPPADLSQASAAP